MSRTTGFLAALLAVSVIGNGWLWKQRDRRTALEKLEQQGAIQDKRYGAKYRLVVADGQPWVLDERSGNLWTLTGKGAVRLNLIEGEGEKVGLKPVTAEERQRRSDELIATLLNPAK